MPSNHLILCHPLLLPPSIFPSLFTQFYTHLVIDVTISSWKQLHPPSSAHLYLLNMLSCSVVSNSATPWITAHQAPLSRGFPRQGYWNGLPFPPPRDLPDPGNEPASPVAPALSGRLFFITSATWEIHTSWIYSRKKIYHQPCKHFGNYLEITKKNKNKNFHNNVKFQALLSFLSVFNTFCNTILSHLFFL